MTDTITVVGTVGTDPAARTTQTGRNVTSLRLASTSRVRDAATGRWRDGETNWYTVNAWSELGRNVHASVRKRERVVVTGRLRVRAWQSEGRQGTDVEIVADSVGHDLRWGTTRFTRAERDGDGLEDDAAAPASDLAADGGSSAQPQDWGVATSPEAVEAGEASDTPF